MSDLSRLDMIDALRRRFDISYAEARSYLEKADWDLVDALVLAEKEESETIYVDLDEEDRQAWFEELELKGQEVIDKLKRLAREGSNRKLRAKRDERVVFEVPLSAGLLGALLAPKLAALGAAACVLTRCSFEIDVPAKDDNGNLQTTIGSGVLDE